MIKAKSDDLGGIKAWIIDRELMKQGSNWKQIIVDVELTFPVITTVVLSLTVKI